MCHQGMWLGRADPLGAVKYGNSKTVHDGAVITMSGVLQRRRNGSRGTVRAYGAGQAFSQKGYWKVTVLQFNCLGIQV